MNVAKTYKAAINTLKPNKARMNAIRAKATELKKQSIEEVNKLIDATGMNAMELYQIACKNKNENETELQKEIRVTLLGMARVNHGKQRKLGCNR